MKIKVVVLENNEDYIHHFQNAVVSLYRQHYYYTFRYDEMSWEF